MARPANASVIGLLPAAGHARRLAPLPCSKELLPLWTGHGDERPRPVCEHALAKMRNAGIDRVYLILRAGKWDIPTHLGNGRPGQGLSIGYLLASLPYGVPFTLDAAYPFVREHRVALGFPDILFEAEDVFDRILDKQDRDGSDVVLGLFPAERPQTMDVVELDGDRVRRILIKPDRTTFPLGWGIAAWKPAFTRFMHGFVAQRLHAGDIRDEVHLGDALQAAIDAGLRVEAIQVSDKPYLDIGSAEGLRSAYRRLVTRYPAP